MNILGAFRNRLAGNVAAWAVGVALLIFPFSAHASPFGGQVNFAIPCWNAAILALIGPPDPGFYLWTPETRTYSNGPPTSGGQWLLGLTTVPYICLVLPGPIYVWPGIGIAMMGSSGRSASPPPPPARPFYEEPSGTGGGAGSSGRF